MTEENNSAIEEEYEKVRQLNDAPLHKRAMYDYLQLEDEYKSNTGVKMCICKMFGMSGNRATKYVEEHYGLTDED